MDRRVELTLSDHLGSSALDAWSRRPHSMSSVDNSARRVEGSQSARARLLPKSSSRMAGQHVIKYATLSRYFGTIDDSYQPHGYGTYRFPYGVHYIGRLDDGLFHGPGTLCFPCGSKIRGEWNQGHLIESTRQYVFSDGLEYKENDWEFCTSRDRRYQRELLDGMQPAGRSRLTARSNDLPVPEGFYEARDGFYDPETKCVRKADGTILRATLRPEEDWIARSCRRRELDSVGRCPLFYECWLWRELYEGKGDVDIEHRPIEYEYEPDEELGRRAERFQKREAAARRLMVEEKKRQRKRMEREYQLDLMQRRATRRLLADGSIQERGAQASMSLELLAREMLDTVVRSLPIVDLDLKRQLRHLVAKHLPLAEIYLDDLVHKVLADMPSDAKLASMHEVDGIIEKTEEAIIKSEIVKETIEVLVSGVLELCDD